MTPRMSTKATTPPLMPPISAGVSPAEANTTVVYLDAVITADVVIVPALVMDGVIWTTSLWSVPMLVDVEVLEMEPLTVITISEVDV